MFRRLVWFAIALAVGAISYSLLRAERRPPAPGEVPAGEGTARRRCRGIVRQGGRCTREALPGRGFCWQHGD